MTCCAAASSTPYDAIASARPSGTVRLHQKCARTAPGSFAQSMRFGLDLGGRTQALHPAVLGDLAGGHLGPLRGRGRARRRSRRRRRSGLRGGGMVHRVLEKGEVGSGSSRRPPAPSRRGVLCSTRGTWNTTRKGRSPTPVRPRVSRAEPCITTRRGIGIGAAGPTGPGGFGRGASSASAPRPRVPRSGTRRSSPSGPMAGSMRPSVRRDAGRNTASTVDAAASTGAEWQGCPPRLVRDSAAHARTASSETHDVGLPRRRRLSPYSRRFVTSRSRSGVRRRPSRFGSNGTASIREAKDRPAIPARPRARPAGSPRRNAVRRHTRPAVARRSAPWDGTAKERWHRRRQSRRRAARGAEEARPRTRSRTPHASDGRHTSHRRKWRRDQPRRSVSPSVRLKYRGLGAHRPSGSTMKKDATAARCLRSISAV